MGRKRKNQSDNPVAVEEERPRRSTRERKIVKMVDDFDEEVIKTMSETKTKKVSAKKESVMMLPDLDDSIFDNVSDGSSVKKEAKDSDEESDMLLPDLDESIFDNLTEDGNQASKKRKKAVKQKKISMEDCIPEYILSTFIELEESELKPKVLESNVKMLADTLTSDPSVSDRNDIIFYVLKYFSLLDKIPILLYKKADDFNKIESPIEDCIAGALIQIDSDAKYGGFFHSFVNNVRQFVLGEDTMQLQSLCALCRVLSKICKFKGNRKEPITLCSDMLKLNHKFSPMLIASIVSEWKELYDIPHTASEEENIFYGSIALGAQKFPVISPGEKIPDLYQKEVKISRSLINNFLTAKPVAPEGDIMDKLFDDVEKKCLKKPYSRDFMLTTPIVIYSAYKGWKWTKQNVVDKHIVSHIARNVDANALNFYCKLFAEVSFFDPGYYNSADVLISLFKTKVGNGMDKLVQAATGQALIQLFLSKNSTMPDYLQKWIEANELMLSSIKPLRQRCVLSNQIDFQKKHLV